MASIDDYIATMPEGDRDAVRHVYDVGRSLAPDAEDGLSYGVPCLKVRGKGLVGVQASARHYSLVPFSAAAIGAAEPELAGLSTAKGSVRFTAAQPLPDAALEAVIRARLAEIGGRRGWREVPRWSAR